MMKRFYLSLVAVGATAALLTAGSFALFTASTSNMNNTFTAGTVTLTELAGGQITINNIAPGDSGTAGTLKVTYTGNLQAWLGLTATSTGDLFAGPTPMTANVKVDGANYSASGATFTIGTSPVATGTVKTFTVHYAMPLGAGNTYQGAGGLVTLSVKAVQAANNTLPPVSGPGPISW